MRIKQLIQVLLSTEVWAHDWRSTTPNCPVLRSLRWFAKTAALSLAPLCLSAIAAVAIEPDKAAFRGQLLRCAIADLDEAEAFLKPLPAVSYVRGLTEHALGRVDRAVAAYDRALGREPGNRGAEQCRKAARIGAHCTRKLERKALLSEWYAGPERHISSDEDAYQLTQTEVHARHPDYNVSNPDRDSVPLGRAYLSKGKLYAALNLFDIALALPDFYPEAVMGRGNALAAARKYQEAIEHFDKVIEFALTGEEYAAVMLARYKEAQRKGEKQIVFGAWLVHSHIERLFVLLVRAYESRALATMELGRLESALDDFNRVLALLPKHILARKYRKNMRQRLQRDDKPVRGEPEGRKFAGAYADLAEMHPELSRRYANPRSDGEVRDFVKRYMKRGLFDLAVSVLRGRMSISEEPWSWREMLAEAYAAAGDRTRALHEYNILMLRPDTNSGALFGRARVYYDQKRFDLAIADLSDEIDRSEYVRKDLFLRALAYAASGKFNHAIVDMGGYVELTGGKSAVAYYALARSHAMVAHYGTAVRRATRAVQLAPKYARAYELRALVYFILAAIDEPWIDVEDQWNGCTPPPE